MTTFKNLLKARSERDPTGTAVIVKQFIREIDRRVKKVKALIHESLIKNDCMAMVTNVAALPEKAFEYRNTQEKIDGFMAWLRTLEQEELLSIIWRPGTITGKDSWTDYYIESAYIKGMQDTAKQLGGPFKNVVSSDLESIKLQFLQPIHADVVALLYQRTYSDLKGVTEAMDAQISRELAMGIVDGNGIEQIAKNIDDRVDKIFRTRARLIARTETIRARNIGAINEITSIGDMIGEDIKVQWWTALDERVRDTHQYRHGKVYTKKKAQSMLGEPNCRCALLPYIPVPGKKAEPVRFDLNDEAREAWELEHPGKKWKPLPEVKVPQYRKKKRIK